MKGGKILIKIKKKKKKKKKTKKKKKNILRPGIQFPVSNWKIVVVCVPSDSVCDISIASSYGNFIENGKVCSGPKAISVAGANGKDEINYKMWVIQTPGLNDPDSFTFKTV